MSQPPNKRQRKAAAVKKVIDDITDLTDSTPDDPDTTLATLPPAYQRLYQLFSTVYSVINLLSNNNKIVKFSMIQPTCTNALNSAAPATPTSTSPRKQPFTFDMLRQIINIDSQLLQLRALDLELYKINNADVFDSTHNTRIVIDQLSELFEIIQGRPSKHKPVRTLLYTNFYNKFKLNNELLQMAKQQFLAGLQLYHRAYSTPTIKLCELPSVQPQQDMSSYGRLIDTCTVPVESVNDVDGVGLDDKNAMTSKDNDVITIDDDNDYDIVVHKPTATSTPADSDIEENGAINGESLNSVAYSNNTPLIKIDPDLQQLIQPKEQQPTQHQITEHEADELLPHNLQGQFRKLLIHLLVQRWYRGQLTHIHTINEKIATTVPMEAHDEPHKPNTPPPALDTLKLHSRVIDVINQQGIKTLYSHQAEAIHKVMYQQQSIVIATSTSSGKTYSYNIPVLQSLCHNRSAKAIYLFPTKALAQDQLRTLTHLMYCFDPDIKVNTYDGDTPSQQRNQIKNESTILLTNPDMLHLSMLPYHHDFKHILSQLKYVVVDEMHVYRGAFGSHVSMVFRRLQRICRHYGSNPTFICCSATIANPKQLAEQLTGVSNIHVIDKDGSPHSAKHVVLWNCPKSEDNPDRTKHVRHTGKNVGSTISKAKASDKYAYMTSLSLADEQRRKSSHVESAVLTSHLVQYNLKTICFAKVRKVCELVTSLVHGYLNATPTTKQLIPLVKSYRGGYTLADRRDTESKLFNGQLRGVISTNALELGIDVGGLDSTVHIGMPLSVSTLWQQAGRCGRGQRDSMSIVVAYDSPFDQYFMANPDKLFLKPSEHAVVDTQQTILLSKHILCATYEMPLVPDAYTVQLFGPSFKECVNNLIDMECIRYHSGKYFVHDSWDKNFEQHNKSVFNTSESEDSIQQKQKTPHNRFSLRTINNNNYSVNDMTKPSQPVTLDQIDDTRAFFDIYPQSIYLYHGKEYVVTSVDHESRIAVVKQIQGRLNYYTKCIDRTEVTVFDRRTLYDAIYSASAPLQLRVPSAELLQQTQLVQSIKQAQADRAMKKTVSLSSVYHMNAGVHHKIKAIQPGDAHLRTYDPPKRNAAAEPAAVNGIKIKADPLIDQKAYAQAVDNGTPAVKVENDVKVKMQPDADIDVVYSIDTSELGANFSDTMEFELPQSVTLQRLCHYGNVTVQTNVYGFRKIEKVSGRILEVHDIHMPTMQTHTQAFWIAVPVAIKRALYAMNAGVAGRLVGKTHGNSKAEQEEFKIKLEQIDEKLLNTTNENKLLAELSMYGTNPIGVADADQIDTVPMDDMNRIDRAALPLSYRAALHALGHGMIGLVQLYILCDALHELGTECPSEYESKMASHSDGHDRILLFENPSVAGLGIARQGCIRLPQLIDSAIQRIQQCECDQIQGCGGCVQGSCYQAGVVSDKRAALVVLKALKALPVC